VWLQGGKESKFKLKTMFGHKELDGHFKIYFLTKYNGNIGL
jgi:hypothetical protein